MKTLTINRKFYNILQKGHLNFLTFSVRHFGLYKAIDENGIFMDAYIRVSVIDNTVDYTKKYYLDRIFPIILEHIKPEHLILTDQDKEYIELPIPMYAYSFTLMTYEDFLKEQERALAKCEHQEDYFCYKCLDYIKAKELA